MTILSGFWRPFCAVEYDALTHTTVFTYDALGRLLAEADPLGRVTRYAYDALSNRTAMTQAVGMADETALRYAYDDVGRLVRLIYPGATVTYILRHSLQRIPSATSGQDRPGTRPVG